MGSQSNMVWAATSWKTNADLIVDCARLGYLKKDWIILDPTWGRGLWWKKWQPSCLVCWNQNKDGSDFRNLPHPDGLFDAVAYDPPYVCVGSRTTTTVPEFHDRYGLSDAPKTPALLQELVNDGLTEMYRLVKPGGNVLVKSKNYVSSGRLWLGAHQTVAHALSLGFEVVDLMQHVGKPGAQSQKTQKHARQNYSTLAVLRK